MTEDSNTRRNSMPMRLAISGALITEVAGISMAVFSIIAGEETGAGALLAASALAFGLLAFNLDWMPRNSASNGQGAQVGMRSDSAQEEEPAHIAAASSETGQAQRDAATDGATPARANQVEASEIGAEPITGREKEVLALVAEGYSNKLISGALGISERTVKNHLTLTMGKLRASDRTHAVVTAVRLGWLEI